MQLSTAPTTYFGGGFGRRPLAASPVSPDVENSPVAVFARPSPGGSSWGRGGDVAIAAAGCRGVSEASCQSSASPPACPMYEASQGHGFITGATGGVGFSGSQSRAESTPPPLMRRAAANVDFELTDPTGSSRRGVDITSPRPNWDAATQHSMMIKSPSQQRGTALGHRLDGNVLPQRISQTAPAGGIPGSGRRERESSPCPAMLPVGPPPVVVRRVNFAPSPPQQHGAMEEDYIYQSPSSQCRHGAASAMPAATPTNDDGEEPMDWDGASDSSEPVEFAPSPRPTKLSDVRDLPPVSHVVYDGVNFVVPVTHGAAQVGVRPTKGGHRESAAEAMSPAAAEMRQHQPNAEGSMQRRRIVPHLPSPPHEVVDDVLDHFFHVREVQLQREQLELKPLAATSHGVSLAIDGDDTEVRPSPARQRQQQTVRRRIGAVIVGSAIVVAAVLIGLGASGVLA